MDTRIIFYEFVYGLFLVATILAYPLLIVAAIVRCLGKCLKSIFCSEKSIEGEVALITGSGRGLGRFIAIELAKRGCHVAIVDIQGQLAEETADFIARTYKVKAKAYKVDVTDFQQLLALRTAVYRDLGHVTILINNAGIIAPACHINPTPHEVQNMINVNLTAMIFTIQLFIPKMKHLNRGHIVNIASMTSLLPSSAYGVYGATKAGVRNMTAALRIDLFQQNCNITATTMLPTFLTTNARINRVVDLVKAYRLGPRVDGDIMAKCTVKAMLNGEEEVAVPRVLLHFYKAFEILPVYFVETITAIVSKPLVDKMQNDEVKTALETPDIDINS